MKFFIPIIVVVLLGIPRIYDNMLFQLAPILLLSAGIFYLIHVLDIRSLSIPRTILLFVIITAIALIRNNNPNTVYLASIYRGMELLFFVLFVLLFFSWFKKRTLTTQKILAFGIVVPFSIYCLLNIIGWLLGFKLEGQEELMIGKCVFLSQFGIDIDRVQFPFGSGINSFATVVGSIMTLAIGHWVFFKKNRFIISLCIVILAVVLVLTDSRSGLFYPVIVVCLVWLIRFFKLRKWLLLLPYVPLVAPFLLLLLIVVLQNLGIINSLSRETEEIASANGRQLIWIVSLTELISFKPIHLIGYGQYGHFASGASEIYGFMFSRWKYGYLTHPHNTVLMVLFDYGYLGLFVLILMFRQINNKIQKLWENNENEISNVFLSFFIYIILITTTESYLGLYYMNALYVFILVIILLNIHYVRPKNNNSSESN